MAETTKIALATELEIRERIADIRSALADGPILPNIWGFYSPKNEQLITLLGDITFIQAVLLEGDAEVDSYSVLAETDADENQAYGRMLLVRKRDGTVEWLFCCRYESTAKHANSRFKVLLEKERARAASAGGCFIVAFYHANYPPFSSPLTSTIKTADHCSIRNHYSRSDHQSLSDQIIQRVQRPLSDHEYHIEVKKAEESYGRLRW